MVKNKKPFIDKKKASTYQLIHRSQRDVAPDHHHHPNYNDTAFTTHNNNNNNNNNDDSGGRMILWPKEDHHHHHSTTTTSTTTTLPSTDRAVLMGVPEDDEHEPHVPAQDDPTTTTTSLLAWKQQLQQMGVLDTVDHEAFLRPITGTGIFVAATAGGNVGRSSTTTTTLQHHYSTTTTKTDSSSFFAIDDAVLEVNRVMESLPLTTDCMDEDIAAILFANDDDDDNNDQDDPLQDYEEMNDDFMLMATGVVPIDDESGADLNNPPTNNNNNNDDDDIAPHRPVTTTQFDFDAHIRQLINTAKLGRDHHSNNNHQGPHTDAEFFAKHWQNTSLWNNNRGHDDEEPHDENYRHVTKSRFLSHNDDDDDHYHDENSMGGGGSSVFTTTTTTITGTAKLLNPDEERALCDKFAATLAEYDEDDDDDDEYGECEEYGEEYPPRHNHNYSNNCMEEDHDDDGITIQSSSLQCATIGRPLVGDAVVEAALDEYLLEREDDILIHGNADRMRRSGGSGFAVLVGKQMINAKVLDNTVTTAPSTTRPVEELHPEQEPAVPIDEYIAMAQETLLRPKEKPPAEEIFIDGKSYYDERPRNPWDCESILSTYSNLDNNPTTIGQSSTRNRRRKNGKSNNDDRSVVSSVSLTATMDQPNFTPQHIRLSAKTGLPMGVFAREPQHDNVENNNSNDDDDDNDDDQGDDTYVSVNKGVKRSKDETPEEKRMRKLMIKRERELARIQKKITKEVYNNEMQKHMPMISEDGMTGKTVFRFS